MKRLAVVAHFDARGQAAPHVVRQLDTLARSFDEVVVATTSALTDDARDTLRSRSTLIERPNLGQDFASWRDGLDHVQAFKKYDEILLTNDSYVGVLNDLEPVITEMQSRPVEAWGLTKTWRYAEHIQSYFLYFSSPVVRSQAFRNFWIDFRPARSRMEAIMRQEVGVGRTLMDAGFRLGSYFEPTRSERKLANVRGVHWLIKRRRAFPFHFHGFEDFFPLRRWRDPEAANSLNWATSFADFVFDDARYPVVKFDTLRYDPHWLGSDRLLELCEQHYPDAFGGVRDYIADTAFAYPGRPLENNGAAKLNTVQRRAYGYRYQDGRLRRKDNAS